MEMCSVVRQSTIPDHFLEAQGRPVLRPKEKKRTIHTFTGSNSKRQFLWHGGYISTLGKDQLNLCDESLNGEKCTDVF